ncbi:MAG TPA: YceI family protein [Bacteroidetes bacterium]|nr:YceI family protein [Bacteroidota bacterium]
MTRTFFIIPICLAFLAFKAEPLVYLTQNGQIHFFSDAPLELIRAASGALRGAISTEKNTFQFSVGIKTFEGFNSPLQKEHFNENYMESNVFPTATFKGKIIEKVDLTVDGEYAVRAKGKLKIHGVERERIIKSRVKVEDGTLQLESSFTVLLAEHGIGIPRIVHHKIAEEIQVKIAAKFTVYKP